MAMWHTAFLIVMRKQYSRWVFNQLTVLISFVPGTISIRPVSRLGRGTDTHNVFGPGVQACDDVAFSSSDTSTVKRPATVQRPADGVTSDVTSGGRLNPGNTQSVWLVQYLVNSHVGRWTRGWEKVKHKHFILNKEACSREDIFTLDRCKEGKK